MRISTGVALWLYVLEGVFTSHEHGSLRLYVGKPEGLSFADKVGAGLTEQNESLALKKSSALSELTSPEEPS
jgi:hypothetical protein